MIDDVVKNTYTPQEIKYQQRINDLVNENILLQEKLKHMEEMNNHLKDNIKDLRHRK